MGKALIQAPVRERRWIGECALGRGRPTLEAHVEVQAKRENLTCMTCCVRGCY